MPPNTAVDTALKVAEQGRDIHALQETVKDLKTDLFGNGQPGRFEDIARAEEAISRRVGSLEDFRKTLTVYGTCAVVLGSILYPVISKLIDYFLKRIAL